MPVASAIRVEASCLSFPLWYVPERRAAICFSVGTSWRDCLPSMNLPVCGSPTPTTSVLLIDAGILGMPSAGTVSPSLSTTRVALRGLQGWAMRAASSRPSNSLVLPERNAKCIGRSPRMLRTTS